MTETQMISCADYDYVEIACLYRYPVLLTMKSGETLSGVASDTKRNTAGEECIELAQSGQVRLVTLTEIQLLDVTIDNPHFRSVRFS